MKIEADIATPPGEIQIAFTLYHNACENQEEHCQAGRGRGKNANQVKRAALSPCRLSPAFAG
jgi:hypothetical protein